MKEKVIACIGDSLTEGDYGVVAMAGIANVQEKNYPYFLKELSGCKVKNHGHCGFTSVMILDLFKNGTIKVDGADIIVVVLGTNGGQSEEGYSENDLAYKEIIRLCKEQSPKAKIFICTPPRPTQDKTMLGYSFNENAFNGMKFVKKYAKEDKELYLIDLYNSPQIRKESDAFLYPNDGLHFGEAGYQILASIIYDNIKKHL